jgi:hypothetical protein
MSLYQNSASLSPARQHQKPVREIRLHTSGALLSASEARYDTLDAYIQQFAAPLSVLRGAGLWSFQDVLDPSLRLLVQCEDIELCTRCAATLHDCACMF